jgi:hypothetical protein
VGQEFEDGIDLELHPDADQQNPITGEIASIPDLPNTLTTP